LILINASGRAMLQVAGMNKLNATSLLVLSALLGCAAAPPPRRTGTLPHKVAPHAGAGRIDVDITGLPSVRGRVYVELYDGSTYFQYDKVLNEEIVPVTGTAMRVSLEHVPAGRYIVAVSHDENANGAMDTGLFGIPTEAYGFSRGARGTFGPPSFDDGAFDFGGGVLRLPIQVR
jgi:uncharacterized protein (DUF2141 family)